MEILFIGSLIFSKNILNQIIKTDSNLVGIVTKKNNKKNNDQFDLSKIANKNNIPYKYANKINSNSSVNWIKKINPELIICVGWSEILSNEILSIPKKGVIGYHPSELPKNRGNHPIIWHLVLGLNSTASTFFFIDKGIDSGNIISQKKVKINKKDNAKTLYHKLSKVSLVQIKQILNNFNKIRSIKQKKINSNYLRKRSEKEGLIDWRMNAINIYNLVRSLSFPYPGAEFVFKNSRIKVWKVKVYKKVPKNVEPGKIFSTIRGKAMVKCGDGAVLLQNIYPKKNLKRGTYL